MQKREDLQCFCDFLISVLTCKFLEAMLDTGLIVMKLLYMRLTPSKCNQGKKQARAMAMRLNAVRPCQQAG